MKYPNFNEEKRLWKKGYGFVVGLDEVGRGPLAGPVVAAAVLINLKFKNQNAKLQFKIKKLDKISDSKKLSEKQREFFYNILTNHEKIKWGIGVVSEKIIDKINILEATKLAMVKAIVNLKSKCQNPNVKSNPKFKVDFLILDGNFKIDTSRFRQGFGEPRQKSIIKGDQKVFSISAASIIAKVTRDRVMEKYDKKYPQYGFKKHKGYPTKAHFASLKKFGPCSIHRKSFYPVRSL